MNNSNLFLDIAQFFFHVLFVRANHCLKPYYTNTNLPVLYVYLQQDLIADALSHVQIYIVTFSPILNKYVNEYVQIYNCSLPS